MTSRDACVEKFRHELDALYADMTRLEAMATAANHGAQDRLEPQTKALRGDSRAATAKLHELVAGGGRSWKALVAETAQARSAIAHSFHDFKCQV